MFLSRIKPEPGFVVSQLTERANAGDAYAQHQLLWQLFASHKNRDFLFRYEQSAQGLCYYVLSSSEPEQTVSGISLSCKPFKPKLSVGDVLAYNLRANPTRMLKAAQEGKRGQRVDVLMHAKHLAREAGEASDEIEALQYQAARDWLTSSHRQNAMGVEFISEPEVTEYQQHQVRKASNGKGHNGLIQFSSVNFQGLLRVVEPSRLIDSLNQGIGRAKSMGCGLMMIRRAS
ncbi:type I-E CRISPR-associated protein Cas6/Cse3/CasE [Saccharospirillum sp.]|uniref:type I-E CRISPR-associated protein Cas6/Cse3/CasE n=1 Tax=Saccharospirillum sp. TaxID=2033801 RepID=UPI00349FF733